MTEYWPVYTGDTIIFKYTSSQLTSGFTLYSTSGFINTRIIDSFKRSNILLWRTSTNALILDDLKNAINSMFAAPINYKLTTSGLLNGTGLLRFGYYTLRASKFKSDNNGILLLNPMSNTPYGMLEFIVQTPAFNSNLTDTAVKYQIPFYISPSRHERKILIYQ